MGLCGENEVWSLLQKYGFKFSKSMGQNFLIDPGIPEKIVKMSGIDETCGVIEVGPGAGALTVALCRFAKFVLAIELDRRLLPVLNESLSGFENVEVISGDILKIDIASLAKNKMPGLRRHACSNLPYNITSPAIISLIGSGVFEAITVMVQKEVARRICAAPGSQDYGAFTVFINYHCSEQKVLFDVPPECFMPRPGVISSVVIMRTRESKLLGLEDEKAFFKVVRAAFGQRRKTLLNALYSVYCDLLKKDDIAEIIRFCGLDTSIRGEKLGLSEFIELARHMSQKYPCADGRSCS